MTLSNSWVLQHIGVVLAAVVVPVLTFLVFIGIRAGRGHYTAGLDALAGIAGVDLGFLGIADAFKGRLAGPLEGLEVLAFIILGLLGIVMFAFLSPVERVLVEYTAHEMGAPGQRRFPYTRLVLSWMSVCSLAALNVLLFVAKSH